MYFGETGETPETNCIQRKVGVPVGKNITITPFLLQIRVGGEEVREMDRAGAPLRKKPALEGLSLLPTDLTGSLSSPSCFLWP